MKGEYISVETAKIMAEIEKENKEYQEIIEKLIEYIDSCPRVKNYYTDVVCDYESLMKILRRIDNEKCKRDV